MKYEIETTPYFDRWLKKIRDKTTLHRFDIRFNRIAKGNFGDVKQIDTNLFELRFFFWRRLSCVLHHSEWQNHYSALWRRQIDTE